MNYQVLSKRMDWPAGSIVDTKMLAGCNIDALVAGGHLAPAAKPTKPAAPADSTAEEPEEHH